MDGDIIKQVIKHLREQNEAIEQIIKKNLFITGYIEGILDIYDNNRDNIKVIHFNADYKNPDRGKDEKQKKSGG